MHGCHALIGRAAHFDADVYNGAAGDRHARRVIVRRRAEVLHVRVAAQRRVALDQLVERVARPTEEEDASAQRTRVAEELARQQALVSKARARYPLPRVAGSGVGIREAPTSPDFAWRAAGEVVVVVMRLAGWTARVRNRFGGGVEKRGVLPNERKKVAVLRANERGGRELGRARVGVMRCADGRRQKQSAGRQRAGGLPVRPCHSSVRRPVLEDRYPTARPCSTPARRCRRWRCV